MDKQQLNYFKKRLLREYQDLNQGLADHEQLQHLSLKESTGELSAYDNHPGDMGTDTFDRELDAGIEDNQRQLLKRVLHSLELIEKGNYGICQQCGRKISSDRLEALPYSILCKGCAGEGMDTD
ncbi:MAG: TraR/DksA C4-type zinc finger protein [Bacillota bacterium]